MQGSSEPEPLQGIRCSGYNWGVFSDNPSLIEGRKIFGENKVYLGGLDDHDGVLVDGTDEEIIAAVHEIMDTFGDKRWILGADCTLPTDVDLHRLHVAEKAASEYRK
ncbi:MAG: uroporphyrinogen decarboxylase family protein [Lachnospiraceae bacterium]